MRYTLLYPHSMLLQSWTHNYMHILLFKPSLYYTRTWEKGLAIIFLPWDQTLTTCAQKRMNGLLKLHSFRSNGLSSSWKEKTTSYGGHKEACQKDPSQFFGLGCSRISFIRKFQLSSIEHVKINFMSLESSLLPHTKVNPNMHLANFWNMWFDGFQVS